ncbi:hypothetical protein RRG08_014755 [Elysia crispata]|uniref:Uncharacterized protein n=1 Tax=Elysia crispata TaxID=231223 RepID=A0AAE1E434_9GAST|nr:hypothetical protein RRG08_014755 [Elysia crispata]
MIILHGFVLLVDGVESSSSIILCEIDIPHSVLKSLVCSPGIKKLEPSLSVECWPGDRATPGSIFGWTLSSGLITVDLCLLSPLSENKHIYKKLSPQLPSSQSDGCTEMEPSCTK